MVFHRPAVRTVRNLPARKIRQRDDIPGVGFVAVAERRPSPVPWLQREKSRHSPDDGKSQGGGPSAWGAAALLSAIDEGLAGIRHLDIGYEVMEFAPRFPVIAYTELRYFTGYEKTGRVVDVLYILTDAGMRYRVLSPAKELHAHILLPAGKGCKKALVNGQGQTFARSTAGKSQYVSSSIRTARRTWSFCLRRHASRALYANGIELTCDTNNASYAKFMPCKNRAPSEGPRKPRHLLDAPRRSARVADLRPGDLVRSAGRLEAIAATLSSERRGRRTQSTRSLLRSEH